MSGFFKPSRFTDRSQIQYAPECASCGLKKHCESPLMKVSGGGQMGILIVGEAPGAVEDEKGTQWVGPAGKLLNESLGGLGIDLHLDCWKTNALICRPPKNQTPTDKQIHACRPNLRTTIEKYRPRSILVLGSTAASATRAR